MDNKYDVLLSELAEILKKKNEQIVMDKITIETLKHKIEAMEAAAKANTYNSSNIEYRKDI